MIFTQILRAGKGFHANHMKDEGLINLIASSLIVYILKYGCIFEMMSLISKSSCAVYLIKEINSLKNNYDGIM